MQNVTLQSAAPATPKWHADIDTPLKYCTCHAKHENDLPSGDFEEPKRAFRARLPSNFTRQSKSSKTPPEALPNGSELTSWRRRRDDDTTTTRRRHDQHDANTGPTPDPNYKREPFATHSGKKKIYIYIYPRVYLYTYTAHAFLRTNISPLSSQHFCVDGSPFPKVGYVTILCRVHIIQYYCVQLYQKFMSESLKIEQLTVLPGVREYPEAAKIVNLHRQEFT